MSDNGAESMGEMADRAKADRLGAYLLPWANASNTPFRYFKIWVHEGGIASPFIASWPGTIPQGRINVRRAGHVIDLLPTALELAGAEYPRDSNSAPLAGMSLLPYLRDPDSGAERTLFWEHGGNAAIRRGRWKLVTQYNDERQDGIKDRLGHREGRWELYDLESDRSELHDRAADYPETTSELKKELQRWMDESDVIDWESAMKAIGTYDSTEIP
jgi:arylsulfatase